MDKNVLRTNMLKEFKAACEVEYLSDWADVLEKACRRLIQSLKSSDSSNEKTREVVSEIKMDVNSSLLRWP